MPLATSAAGAPVGVTISFTEIVAADSRLNSAAGWRMTLEAPNPELGSWPSLATALRTLATLTREQNGRLAIALLSPMSEVRKLDLPALSDDELEMFLARNPARYFVGARGPQITSVTAGERKGTQQGAVAAALPAWIVRLVTVAAKEAGWKVLQLLPAQATWVTAVTASWPSAAKGNTTLLVHHADRTDVLQLHEGALVNVRRLRSALSDVPVLIESLSGAPALMAFGNATARKEWSGALASRAFNVSLPTSLPPDVANDAALVAAAFAVSTHTMLFRTDDMRQADRARRNRLMWAMLAASAALLIAAAGFSFWDVKRELIAVQSQRAAIKPQLATTMVGRASVETVSGQLQMLATAERESPHWSTVISELTDHLPEDAYLVSLRGRSDTVLFEGMASHAALVFPALDGVESFTGVKAAASVRREAGESGEALERFTLAAKLRSAPAVDKPKSIAPGLATASGTR